MNYSNSSGIGFSGLLTLVFVVLKLTGVITWSWWWVLLPTLVPVVLLAVIGFVSLFIIEKYGEE